MRSLFLGTLALLSTAAASVMAAENVVGDAVKRCGHDIDTYCAHVKPGSGRLVGCLYSHDDKISSECGMALNAMALQHEAAAAQSTEIVEACETERETFCPTEQWGHGGVVRCLSMQSHTVESVSAGCRHTLEKYGLK